MASFAHFYLFPSITYARTLCEFHILYVYYMLLCPIWGSQMCSTINQNHLILVSCAKCSGNEHVRRKHFWLSTSNTLKIPSYSKQYFISYCIRLNRERKKKMYAPFGILEKKFETLINLKQCQLMNDVGWCIMSGGNMHAIDECKRWTSASKHRSNSEINIIRCLNYVLFQHICTSKYRYWLCRYMYINSKRRFYFCYQHFKLNETIELDDFLTLKYQTNFHKNKRRFTLKCLIEN